ncbi:MAG: hypothetical protein ABI333_15990 [bacterium]
MRRGNVREFARAAKAFRRVSTFPVGEVVLEPGQSQKDLLEDIEDAKPKVVLALGPMAAGVLSRGLGAVPVVFAYLSRRPATTALHGGWLALGARSQHVLQWVERLRPGVKTAAVVVRDGGGALATSFRKACRRAGIKALVAVAMSSGGALRSVVALMTQRPGALWLGHHVELYPPAVLRQLVQLQARFRMVVVGLTPEHTRVGLAMSLDGGPEQVARAAHELIRSRIRRWLLSRPARRNDSGGSRGRGTSPQPKPEASQLTLQEVKVERVTLNERSAAALGLDWKRAVAAGARRVRP